MQGFDRSGHVEARCPNPTVNTGIVLQEQSLVVGNDACPHGELTNTY